MLRSRVVTNIGGFARDLLIGAVGLGTNLRERRRRRFRLVGMKHVAWLLLLVGTISSCGGAVTSRDAGFETYSQDGNVWIVSDCPNTDQVLSGNPDGLPPIDDIQTREVIEAWLDTAGDARIVPRNGEAWGRNEDGTVFTALAEDYMVEITLRDASECPDAPIFMSGVPVIYRLPDDS